MALRMPKMRGADASVADGTDFDPPTTQVRMVASPAEPFDPMTPASGIEQIRVAANAAPVPSRLALIGGLPVVRQFQILGALAFLFAALAVLVVYLDNGVAERFAQRVRTVSDMQTMSQRLARAAAQAAQGERPAFVVVRDSRQRFADDLAALPAATPPAASWFGAAPTPAMSAKLAEVRTRWQRVDAAVAQLLGRERDVASAPGSSGAAVGAAAVPDAGAPAARSATLALARTIDAEAEPLLGDAGALAGLYEGGAHWRLPNMVLAVVLALFALGCLALAAKVLLADARTHSQESEHENKRNQEAILRLLNEMGNLADGDLTVQASVTEDVTGAIADSINFTIDELRTLVRGINSATDQVTKATQETQAISNRLYEASQHQNREIQQASASVLSMARSISEVATHANQSAKVAQAQLAAAEQGGRAVQNQIAGMNDIRTQIQDTSKRIKRLGESSLEIGEIVELISDITEQTNVLALNAAIQAASAGEAGRGFTVVAEEVQRLAERSGEATKQIEAIVKTIQADTQDAVGAMEKSTVGVVEGAKLSDAAGQALAEIQRVSRELAELIGQISARTQTQSESVSEVTRGMQAILRVSEEATEGSKQTNVSIGQLTRLAAELRSSVAGFKV
ncbi:MAG TPA: methyl-accepting chemotaxis protein [Casimicrobiaceae bacterium]